MILTLGSIKIEKIVDEFNDKSYKYYRLTLDYPSDSMLDNLEAEGETLAEALIDLHEQVEILNV